MSLDQNDSGRSCWNCGYGITKDQTRCPRCGIPVAGAAARPTASAAPPAKGRSNAPRQVAAAAPKSRRRSAAPAAARVEVIPPKPAEPGRLARLGSSAGRGLRQSFGLVKRIGSATAAAYGRVAGGAARLVTSTAHSVTKGTTQLVARRPGRSERLAIDVDALRRENARTLADVAELLLRETREETEGLKDRLARLEAAIVTKDAVIEPETEAPSTEAARPAPRRPAKRSAPRATQKRGTTRKREPRRSGSAQEGRVVRETPSVALAPELESALRDANDVEMTPIARRSGARRRARAQSQIETAG